MKNQLSKGELVAKVRDLNTIINSISKNNCYDKVIEFFRITSELGDRTPEICKLPRKGVQLFGTKSSKRVSADKHLSHFLSSLRSAGRDEYGVNRTSPGETITKDKIFFGNIEGLNTLSVTACESIVDDRYLQNAIRGQICRFVRSYRDHFDINWVK